jgi:hypothetical protein
MLHQRQYYWRRCVYEMDLRIKLSIAGVTTLRRNANCRRTWREVIISVCMMRCEVPSHIFKHCVNGLHQRILGGSAYIQQDVKHLTYVDNCNEDVTFLLFLIIIPCFSGGFMIQFLGLFASVCNAQCPKIKISCQLIKHVRGTGKYYTVSMMKAWIYIH